MPRSRNAGVTLAWMSAILAALLISITFLAVQIGAVPSEHETIISQLARTTYGGRGVLYLLTMAGTTVILIMAANTSYTGFPRLAALLAIDGFLPRQLAFQGSRLVYSRASWSCTLLSHWLHCRLSASVTALIPLYAIGVFLSFTLSQAGMAHRWWKSGRLAPGQERREQGSTLVHEPGWRARMNFNGLGLLVTAMVTVIFALTKFTEGAWIVLVVLPTLMWLFFRIHRHYRQLARDLSLDEFQPELHSPRHRVIIPIGGVHRGTWRAMRYAKTLSDDVTAVHVATDPAEAKKLEWKWEIWGGGVRLVIVDSPYRLMHEPLLEYIEAIAALSQPNEIMTVVVPHFVPQHALENLLHSQTAELLRLALLSRPDIVVTDVPYQVR